MPLFAYSCNLKCSLQGHWRSGKGWKAASPVVISYCRMKIMNPAMLVESVVRQCCRLGQHNHIITAALPTSLPAFPPLISITCLWSRQGRSAPTKKNCKQEKSPVRGRQAAKWQLWPMNLAFDSILIRFPDALHQSHLESLISRIPGLLSQV